MIDRSKFDEALAKFKTLRLQTMRLCRQYDETVYEAMAEEEGDRFRSEPSGERRARQKSLPLWYVIEQSKVEADIARHEMLFEMNLLTGKGE